MITAWKASKYGVFFGPYFPAFGLNTERYGVSLPIHSECGKILTRENSVFGHFSKWLLLIIFKWSLSDCVSPRIYLSFFSLLQNLLLMEDRCYTLLHCLSRFWHGSFPKPETVHHTEKKYSDKKEFSVKILKLLALSNFWGSPYILYLQELLIH